MTHKTGARERGNADTRRAMRRTWAEIDLDAIDHNLRALGALVPESCRIMAVVKADAYGHGIVEISQAALSGGATWLGVATFEEGMGLRRAGIEAPVLVLGTIARQDVPEARQHQLRVTISSPEVVDDVASAAGPAALGVHLKVDTGMHRLGVLPEDVVEVVRRLVQLRVPLEGCYTHLACADDPDPAFTQEQVRRFVTALAQVRRHYPSVLVHAASSAAVLVHPETHYDMVRVGLAMYGLYPAPHLRATVSLRPAMRFLSRVVRVAHLPAGATVSYGATYRVPAAAMIATVACGYGDGYPRLASNRGKVRVGDQLRPVVGRVCMDHLMVHLGDDAAALGDEVLLFGEGPSADDLADWAGTISYEILCGVAGRMPRIYLRGGHPVAVHPGNR